VTDPEPCRATGVHPAHGWRGRAGEGPERPCAGIPEHRPPHVHVWDYHADPTGTCACGEPPQRVTRGEPARATFRVRVADCRFPLHDLSPAHMFPAAHTPTNDGPVEVTRLDNGELLVEDGRHHVIRARLAGREWVDAVPKYPSDDTFPTQRTPPEAP
jgi:hypothetical protein